MAAAAALALAALAPVASAATVRAGEDRYGVPVAGQHATAVEPDSFAAGDTIVAAFQVGRIVDGGAANIGWAFSGDAGASWTDGVLPGITTVAGGPYPRVSDPAVAYDPEHDVWMVASLALGNPPTVRGEAIVVNRSTDGGKTWTEGPVTVADAGAGSDFDKNWIACDGTPSSPHYGNCYVQWDDIGKSGRLLMSTSKDGGETWGAPKATAGGAAGLGGQPVVQPNGTVVVPYVAATLAAIRSFRSTDGGATWKAPVGVSPVLHADTPGDMRSGPLPSAEADGSGRVYVAWEDCRFRPDCSSNDIVLASSADGRTWSAVRRVPIDAVTSGAEHFVPGLGVDRDTSGAGAHLGLAYHHMPTTDCTPSTCRVRVGFVDSLDGGRSWSAPVELTGAMTPTSMADTTQGYMTGDYISTSFVAGLPHPVFAYARAKPSVTTFDEAIYSASPPLAGPVTRTLSKLRIDPARFRAKNTGPSIAGASGTRVAYRASAAGRTRFKVRRAVRRQGERVWVRVPGDFRRTDVAGHNAFRFTGRLGGRLGPGLYRLLAQPRRDGRAAGESVFVRFTILKP